MTDVNAIVDTNVELNNQVTEKEQTTSPVQDLAVQDSPTQTHTVDNRVRTTSARANNRHPRRLIICCDGTWQDGLQTQEEDEYTNVLRLTRAIRQEDRRNNPPTIQVTHYISGVGTGWSVADKLVGGATGNTLGVKIRDAYSFISQNYCDGDEIFLFGFSRGAFTARTLGALINDIGILNNKEMDHFFDIFQAYQDRNDTLNKKKVEEAQKKLDPWLLSHRDNKRHLGRQFLIKCIGVFDTVGALGIPKLGSSLFKKHEGENYMGFPDTVLGDRVEHCYHALALHENREQFIDTRFEVKEETLKKGQKCKQTWFTGCHSDIGGSYKTHELSDLTLIWMAAHIEHLLLLDIDYLKGIPNPMAPWGQQRPHNSSTGIFALTLPVSRKPKLIRDGTERIHRSCLENECKLVEPLKKLVEEDESLLDDLLPLEEEFRAGWKLAEDHENRRKTSYEAKAASEPFYKKIWNKLKSFL